jgi:hypothetical protein
MGSLSTEAQRLYDLVVTKQMSFDKLCEFFWQQEALPVPNRVLPPDEKRKLVEAIAQLTLGQSSPSEDTSSLHLVHDDIPEDPCERFFSQTQSVVRISEEPLGRPSFFEALRSQNIVSNAIPKDSGPVVTILRVKKTEQRKSTPSQTPVISPPALPRPIGMFMCAAPTPLKLEKFVSVPFAPSPKNGAIKRLDKEQKSPVRANSVPVIKAKFGLDGSVINHNVTRSPSAP